MLELKQPRKHSSTSVIVRHVLEDSSQSDNRGLTGLTNSSSGLVISAVADVEATTTVYSAASSNIETITTLGTYGAPSASKCRFKEVDATNHPGLYEFQFLNSRFSVTNAKALIVTVRGATNLKQTSFEIPLTLVDMHEAPATINEVADGYLDRADAIETGLTPRQAMRLTAAAAAGEVSGATGGSATVVVRNAVADSKNRISATTDGNGNRSAVTTDVT